MRFGVLAIGNFDGVHLGHAALLKFAYERACARGLPLQVLTFDPLPVEYFSALQGASPKPPPSRICTLEQRVQFLTDLGVSEVAVEPFTTALQQLTPQKFFSEILINRYAAQEVVVGKDFYFGHQRAGNVSLLKQLCTEASVACHAVGLLGNKTYAQQAGMAKYSSSNIRAELRAGNLDSVNRQLGYSWQLTGCVETGDQRGTQLGFATANIAPDLPLPGLRGVFVSSLCLHGKWLNAVTNIGTRPTFSGSAVNCETHLLHSSQASLYNIRVGLALHHKLREEKQFDDSDTLVQQIAADVATARSWHATHRPVFTPCLGDIAISRS